MESTLFLAIKDDDSEFIDQIAWMLGDDAPVFDEDVKPQWQSLFKILEDLQPPDELVQIGKNRIVLNWLCADAEEELSTIATIFTAAGISRCAAYIWYDDYENIVLLQGGHYTNVDCSTKCQPEIMSLVKQYMKGWGTGKDRKTVCRLLEVLE